MTSLPPDLLKALYGALEAFGARRDTPTRFARYWWAVGPVEDYAAGARTRAERILVQLLRALLENELRRSAFWDPLHPDARGVEEYFRDRCS